MILLLVLKFVVAFVPIIIGLFVSNLVYIIKFAGLAGYFIALFVPITLQFRSIWVCRENFSFLSNSSKFEMKKVQNSDNDDTTEKEDDRVTTNGDLLEKEALIDQTASPSRTETKPFSLQKLKTFFFSFKDSYLYYTPYSTILSHPLCVIASVILSVILLILGVTSLFVHPTII